MIRLRSVWCLSIVVVSFGCSGGGGGGSGSGFGLARSEIALGNGADSVQLSWTASPSELPMARAGDQLGYRIYHRAAGGEVEAVTVGAVSSVLVHGLESGDHEFSVTSLTSSGSESDFSSPVQISLP